MVYSYGGEPIDPRTLALQNARPGVESLFIRNPEEELREQENLLLQQQLQQLAGMEDSDGGYADYNYAYPGQEMPVQEPVTQMQPPAPPKPPARMNSGSSYGEGKPGGSKSKNKSSAAMPDFSWKAVFDLLQKIAQHELAGVVIYTILAESLSGLYGDVVAEKFNESATEGLTHYKSVVEMIRRLDLSQIGGMASVDIAPSADEVKAVQGVIKADGSETVMPALIHAINFEFRAVKAYKQLSDLICGHDEALENWAMFMVEEETRHAFRFEKLAGLK